MALPRPARSPRTTTALPNMPLGMFARLLSPGEEAVAGPFDTAGGEAEGIAEDGARRGEAGLLGGDEGGLAGGVRVGVGLLVLGGGPALGAGADCEEAAEREVDAVVELLVLADLEL